ncbi:hypothetical protein CVT26_005158, partial [Gymnopilus dilepis]
RTRPPIPLTTISSSSSSDATPSNSQPTLETRRASSEPTAAASPSDSDFQPADPNHQLHSVNSYPCPSSSRTRPPIPLTTISSSSSSDATPSNSQPTLETRRASSEPTAAASPSDSDFQPADPNHQLHSVNSYPCPSSSRTRPPIPLTTISSSSSSDAYPSNSQPTLETRRARNHKKYKESRRDAPPGQPALETPASQAAVLPKHFSPPLHSTLGPGRPASSLKTLQAFPSAYVQSQQHLATSTLVKVAILCLGTVELVIESLAGLTILLPSAVIAHSKTPVQQGECRYSFAQYLAGGISRRMENDFKPT